MSRKLLFSVTIDDCEVQHFRSGGNGGQNQNKRDTGTRVIHHPSGARGESREERSQLQNKRTAFCRMVKTKEFQTWARTKGRGLRPIEDVVAEQMEPENLRIEARINNKWQEASDE